MLLISGSSKISRIAVCLAVRSPEVLPASRAVNAAVAYSLPNSSSLLIEPAFLAAKALFLGWDIICLGRTGSAQSFQTGRWGSKLSIHREGKALWIERAAIEAGDLLMRSKAGLSGCSVYATFVATVQTVQASLIQECRTVMVEKGVASVSQLPGLLVGRYLGDSSQAAKNYFIALWQKVRPVAVGCEAQRPRIWNT